MAQKAFLEGERKYVPGTEIDHSHSRVNALHELQSVALENLYLILRLVKLGDRDNVIPDQKAIFVVQQLIGQSSGLTRLGSCLETILQPGCDKAAHLATANVDDASVLDHGDGYES